MQVYLKKIIVLLLAFACLSLHSWAETTAASQDDDSMFNNGGDQTAEPTTAPNPINAAAKKPLSFSATFNAAGGFLSGYKTYDRADLGFEGLSVTGGVTISSTLNFTARFSPVFSFQGGLTVVYPNTDNAITNPTGGLYTLPGTTPIAASTGLFAVSINDIYADYSMADILFVKVGRFSQTWGNSYFFKSSDIINRYIPGTLSDGLRLKLSVPIGPVNVALLGQAFNGYFTNLDSISVSNIGYAMLVDVPIGPVEIGLGGFYQKQLTPRVMLNLKSSISPIDFFCDVTLALDYNGAAYPRAIDSLTYPAATNTVYLCVSAGLYGDIKEIESQIYLEYLYNGERQFFENTRVWQNLLPDSYKPGGHNVSFLWRWKRSNNSVLQPLAQIAYNFSDNSAVIVPGLIIYITDSLKLQLGLPIYFDSNKNANMLGEAGYLSSNILNGHSIGLAVRLMLSGTATTD